MVRGTKSTSRVFGGFDYASVLVWSCSCVHVHFDGIRFTHVCKFLGSDAEVCAQLRQNGRSLSQGQNGRFFSQGQNVDPSLKARMADPSIKDIMTDPPFLGSSTALMTDP